MGTTYTKMKIFHYPDKLKSIMDKTITAPIHLRIKPTNVCNHNCKYCAYRTNNLQVGKDMIIKDYIPESKMMEIIDDITEIGVKAVTFSGGGEPLLYPFMLNTLKKISKTSIKFSVLTNGSKLINEIAEVLANHGTWIRISIDGWDDESYSFYRGVPKGEFTKILKNIEHFKKIKGKCLVGVVIIVDKTNHSHIYDLIKTLKNVGVNSIKISPCLISNDTNENNNYHESIFTSVKEQINKSVNELKDANFEIFDSYNIQLETTFKKNYTWCPYIQILHVIGADQNIYTCQDKAYNLERGLIGSIKNTRYKDFWLINKNNCLDINPAIHCLHHCVSNEKNKIVLEYFEAKNNHLEFV